MRLSIALVLALASASSITPAVAETTPIFSGHYVVYGMRLCPNGKTLFAGTFTFDPSTQMVDEAEYSASVGSQITQSLNSESYSYSSGVLMLGASSWTAAVGSDKKGIVESAAILTNSNWGKTTCPSQLFLSHTAE